MQFEWDEVKNRINQQDHDGISFEGARAVFDDPFVIFRKDRIDENGEQRWHAIGALARQRGVTGRTRVSHGERKWKRRNHPYHLSPRS